MKDPHTMSMQKRTVELGLKAFQRFFAATALLAAGSALAAPVIYEGEEAVLAGGCATATDHRDFSGKGFVARFHNNATGTATFTVMAEQAGPQEITLRYSAGFNDAAVKLEVNGQAQTIIMPSTEGNWDLWSHKVVSFNLNQGANKIVVGMTKADSNCINLDYLALGKVLTKPYIEPPPPPAPFDAKERVALLKKAGVEEIVVIVRNFIGSSHNYTYFNEGFKSGGGLYVFNKDGFRQLIDASQGEILDAELSYDGKQLLCSWKKDGNSNYDIFLLNLDGTGMKQLTRHPGNDFNASWLPDGGIAFLSDRDNNYAYCMHSSSAVLYRMQLDGTGLKRLSANYLSDIAPHVINDGKIVYCRWEYVDRFQIPCQGLWAQNPDGTALKRIYGGRFTGIGSDPVTLSEAKSVPGTNKLIATLTGHNGAICGGIGIIDPSKGSDSMDSLTTILGEAVVMRAQGSRNPRQKYEFAYPVNTTYFLVSNDGSIQMSTYDGKDVTTILPKGNGPAINHLGFYAALPVQVRGKEPVIQGSLPSNTEGLTAKVYMQDIYVGLEDEIAKGTLKRGDITQIRVVEGLGKSNKGSQSQRAFCWQFPVVSAGATMEPKKTLSVINVEADGSAMFEVPAMKPVFFHALDREGRVVQRMRTFAQFMPGEVQGCTGCHLDRNTSVPLNSSINRTIALKKPMQMMNGAPWKEHPSAFSYPEQIQPIWDKHCISCHNAKTHPKNVDLSGDRTDLFNVSYDNLVRDGANQNPSKTGASPEEFPHIYVSYIPSYNGSEHRYMAKEYFRPKAWGSYKSKLADLIYADHPDKDGKKRIELTDLEKRTIYCWIDYNIPYYQTSHTNHPELPHGMRELVPQNYDAILTDVAERRCAGCHKTPLKTPGWFSWCNAKKPRTLPLKFYLRWEKPELNNFMLAPLAKAAGGTEKCGEIIFKDQNDPDYQKLLRAFDPIQAMVKELPRMDMPGAKEERGKYHSLLYANPDVP
jgi:hypothetical protein